MENDITHTLHSFLGSGNGNVLMVTSCQVGDGATYCSLESAKALCENTNIEKVLIVESSIEHLKCAEAEAQDKVSFHISRPDDQSGIHFLVAKSLSRRLENNLNALLRVISKVKVKYDLVILDCSAISHNRMLYSLLKEVNGVLVVITAASTRKPVIANTIEAIKYNGGNVLGVLLNKRRFYIPRCVYRWFF